MNTQLNQAQILSMLLENIFVEYDKEYKEHIYGNERDFVFIDPIDDSNGLIEIRAIDASNSPKLKDRDGKVYPIPSTMDSLYIMQLNPKFHK